jgi:ABC-2 type transport system permease protein
MNIQKTLNVARWEFMEKIRSRAFIASLLVTPLLFVVIGGLQAFLMKRGDDETKRFAMYDETMSFVAPLQERLNERYKLPNGKPMYELAPVDAASIPLMSFMQSYTPRVFREEFRGLFIIRKDLETTHKFEYRSNNVGNERDVNKIESALEKVLAEQLAVRSGITIETYKNISKPLEAKMVKISKNGESKESGFGETFATAYVSMMLLFMLNAFTGQMLVRGLLGEKNNRIMEILVSSVSPTELMFGKLFGLCAVGIVQAVAWISLAIGVAGYFGSSLTNILAGLPWIALFTTLGYILNSSMLLGVGSIASSEQEAQQIAGYFSILLIVPLVAIIPIVENSNSTIARVLSFIPFTAPTAMIARISVIMPPIWEILVSVAGLLATIMLVMYAAAKIFRAAILMYGKRPTLPEIIGFLRD